MPDFGFTVAGPYVEQRDLEDALQLYESWSFNLDGGAVHFDRCDQMFGSIESRSVDCVVTDPAYWTLDRWREMGTTTRLGGHRDAEKRSGWFETIDQDDLVEVIDECSRLLKKNGHCWMMCDGQTLPYVLGYGLHGDCHDFKYIKPYPILKRAVSGGYKQGMGYHGRCCHEYVVLLEKGRRRFTEENWPDVFDVVWSGDVETRPFTSNGKPYPTAKPLALFSRWIELSTAPGEVVFDPFMGSGTALVAAIQSGRRFIGIDRSPEAVRVTMRRIEKLRRGESEQGALFQDNAAKGG